MLCAHAPDCCCCCCCRRVALRQRCRRRSRAPAPHRSPICTQRGLPEDRASVRERHAGSGNSPRSRRRSAASAAAVLRRRRQQLLRRRRRLARTVGRFVPVARARGDHRRERHGVRLDRREVLAVGAEHPDLRDRAAAHLVEHLPRLVDPAVAQVAAVPAMQDALRDSDRDVDIRDVAWLAR